MADSNQPSSTTRKPYSRVITEKRREQNRTSQKKYRERLRKRLEELEEKVATTTDSSVADSKSLSQQQSQVSSEISTRTNTQRPTEHRNTQASIVFSDVFEAAGDLALPQEYGSSPHSFQVSFLTNHDSSHLPLLEAPSTAASPSPAPSEAATCSPCTALDYLPKPDPDSIDLRSVWPVPVEAQMKPYIPPPRQSSSGSVSPFSLRSRSATSIIGIPDPYLNYIQVDGSAWMGVSLAIATALGISRSAYINDHPSLFYHSTAPNFYHLPKALRPTPAQLTLAHPVYLDCIIFPTFRSRAIILSARGELDHVGLFVDLWNDGLICWGNAEATAVNGRGMRDGVAWSTRSWEAKHWFLQRWEALVGVDGDEVEDFSAPRDDDQIWENSRWWWQLRGDVC